MKNILLVIFSTTILLSCKEKTPENNTFILENNNKGTFKIAADSNTAFLVNQLKDCYEAAFDSVHLQITYADESGAIENILKDSARLLVLDRKLTDNEWQRLNNKFQTKPIEHFFAYDAIALVSSKNQVAQVLKKDELAQKIKEGKISFVTIKQFSSQLIQLNQMLEIEQSRIKINIVQNYDDLQQYLDRYPEQYGLLPFSQVSDSDMASAKVLAKKFHWLGFETDSNGVKDTIYPTQSSIRTKEYPFIKEYNIVACAVKRDEGMGFVNFIFKTQVGKLVLKNGLIPKVMPERAFQITESEI